MPRGQTNTATKSRGKSKTQSRSRANQSSSRSRATASRAASSSSRSKTATASRGRATGSASARRTSAGTGRARDAITLLTNDHKEMRRLLKELKAASGDSRRAKVLEQVQTALKTHTMIEEQIFYPAFRDAARKEEDRELFYEAHAEHDAADLILGEVSTAQDEQFSARAKVLMEIVEHHAKEEEEEMFPRARKLLDQEELRRLGGEMTEMKQNGSASTGAIAAVTSAVRRVVG
ncbi:MAG TPA: hemerythrin domain-containing protein [Terriglobales bacterium]|nr:hemerythrin domain-containing protein [Terriglobales bacterium]